MRFFYLPDINESEVYLPGDESKHCIRVLRLGQGDQVKLVDGKGNLYTGVISDPDIHKCRVEITRIEREYGKQNHHLHVAIAPTKSADRFEWFLEKSTEIGVDEITPIICKRSERETIRTDRAEKIMVSAMKQSGRAYLPVIHSITQYETLIKVKADAAKIICHCESDDLQDLGTVISNNSNVLVLIGPEGDFTPEEIDLATRNGFIEAGMGPFIYRTETAGIQVCAVFSFIHGK